jgi:hypothetical protein
MTNINIEMVQNGIFAVTYTDDKEQQHKIIGTYGNWFGCQGPLLNRFGPAAEFFDLVEYHNFSCIKVASFSSSASILTVT